LYDTVWREPMTKVAKAYGISDVGLKKICTKHGIPVPGRGYWARVEAGQTIERPRLGTRKNTHVRIPIHPKLKTLADDLPEQAQTAVREVTLAFDSAPGAKLHPIAGLTEKLLIRSSIDKYGMAHCLDAKAFRVRVSPASFQRAVHIVDTVVKACERSGFKLQAKVRGPYSQEVCPVDLVLDNETVDFSIEERASQRAHVVTDEERQSEFFARGYRQKFDHSPSGELTIIAENCYGVNIQRRWTDKPNRPVELNLHEVVAALVAAVQFKKHDRVKALERERQAAAAEEERARREAEEKAERAAFAQLEAEVQDWQRAVAIRTYASALEMIIDPNDHAGIDRIRWMREQADRMDPLARKR